MSDHDDLIDALKQKSRGEYTLSGLPWGDWICGKAADAIAALVAERDEALSLKREAFIELDKAEAERDAAHALLREARIYIPDTEDHIVPAIDALIADKEPTDAE